MRPLTLTSLTHLSHMRSIASKYKHLQTPKAAKIPNMYYVRIRMYVSFTRHGAEMVSVTATAPYVRLHSITLPMSGAMDLSLELSLLL